ncbi:MAG TPA: hypothetical protein VKZ59_09385 [Acidobacteriota bacterium]|nr:hypothetical protein [Acidobacteriota bacterium]
MSQHNEIIERTKNKVLARAFRRIAQCEVGGSVPSEFILFVYDEVIAAFKDGVNAKADAMMADQAEGGSE